MKLKILLILIVKLITVFEKNEAASDKATSFVRPALDYLKKTPSVISTVSNINAQTGHVPYYLLGCVPGGQACQLAASYIAKNPDVIPNLIQAIGGGENAAKEQQNENSKNSGSTNSNQPTAADSTAANGMNLPNILSNLPRIVSTLPGLLFGSAKDPLQLWLEPVVYQTKICKRSSFFRYFLKESHTQCRQECSASYDKKLKSIGADALATTFLDGSCRDVHLSIEDVCVCQFKIGEEIKDFIIVYQGMKENNIAPTEQKE